MASSLPSCQINPVIRLDSGRSVVFSMVLNENKYKIAEENTKFVNAFERIFAAAARGDLKTCKDIVEEEKFPDVDAYGIGQFVLGNGDSLNYISPRKIAQMRGHTQITQYFAKHFGEKKEPDNDIRTPENIRSYSFHLRAYMNMAPIFFLSAIRERVLSTYTFSEQIELVPELTNMSIERIYMFLKTRCGQKFTNSTPHELQKRIELCAMRDALAERIKKCDEIWKPVGPEPIFDDILAPQQLQSE